MLPLFTTTISVKRFQAGTDIDPYVVSDDSDDEIIASGVPAAIGTRPRGTENVIGGQQSNLQFRFYCAPTDVTHTDNIYDETTGKTYEISWVTLRTGLGLEHVEGELILTEGVSNG